MYTQKDISDATKFAQTNVKIKMLRLMYLKAPHIISHLKVNLRPATGDDYYIPAALTAACQVLDIDMTKESCELLSCNPAKEKGMCTVNDSASYYYVGDDAYDVQCQPACFNSSARPTYNEDGSRAPDTPMLNFHDGMCRLVPSSIVTYLEKPYYRSDTHYEFRLNDMPTGFSRTVDTNNRYGSGFNYKTNATYCQYYDKTLQSDGSCDMTIWEKILDSVLGMSLINTIKSSIRMLTNDGKPFTLPNNLPPLPSKMAEVYTREGWLNNINASFVPPEEINTIPNIITQHDIVHERHKKEYENQQQNKHNQRRLLTHSKQRATNKIDDNDDDDDDDNKDQEWYDTVKDIFVGLLEGIATDPEFWTSVGVGIVTETMLSQIKSLGTKIVERLAGKLNTNLVSSLGKTVASNVLKGALRGVSSRMVVSFAVRIGAKVAIALAKFAAAAASVVGWILAVVMVLDILFTFWDPYGYKNMFPPEMPATVMASGERAYRVALESATANYEFDQLVALLLNEDEMLEIHTAALIDTVRYLDSLVVNAEGTRIDKGDDLLLLGASSTDFNNAKNEALARRIRFNSNVLTQYNKEFIERTRANKKFVNYGIWAGIGLLSVGFLGSSLLLVLSTLLILVLAAIARYSLQSEDLNRIIIDYFRQTNDDE
jgi:hypothetical protein